MFNLLLEFNRQTVFELRASTNVSAITLSCSAHIHLIQDRKDKNSGHRDTHIRICYDAIKVFSRKLLVHELIDIALGKFKFLLIEVMHYTQIDL